MPRLRHTVEQILSKLREAEVALSKGQPVAQVCRTLRWLRLFGQFLRVHKWRLAGCAYAAVGRAGKLSQYTRSGVRPSSARCGLS